jgi:hypothetical protein
LEFPVSVDVIRGILQPLPTPDRVCARSRLQNLKAYRSVHFPGILTARRPITASGSKTNLHTNSCHGHLTVLFHLVFAFLRCRGSESGPRAWDHVVELDCRVLRIPSRTPLIVIEKRRYEGADWPETCLAGTIPPHHRCERASSSTIHRRWPVRRSEQPVHV